MLLAVELIDELVGGTRAAAWPLIRADLHLSYAQIGLVLTVPSLVGSMLDPIVGAIGDTPRRRMMLVAGGAVFAAATVAAAGAVGVWSLLAAFVLFDPASGAFVGLSQATMIDLDPRKRARGMAWWTLAGSVGYVGGPVLLAAALWIGVGWRGVFAALAAATVPLVLVLRRLPAPVEHPHASVGASLRAALRSLREREVLRWLLVLEAIDLLVDVFHAFLALYFVDDVGVGPAVAALGVGVWTAAALVGDAVLIGVLRHVAPFAYLRTSASLALVLYPAFLLAPGTVPKLVLVAALGLVNSGWYAIPKAALYDALPGRSGAAVAVGGVGGLAGAVVPLALGALAGAVGLGPTMWTLLAAPVALLALVPRRG